ncbi:hypothetical protein [Tritonibacter sp. AK171]|uniref:hypothetical protein n=1 Tax=Tritonibacter sp. AK171 TaxID=3048493 RepID=UPI0024C439B8|nr:hypothetical protein [Tritonibacter sp. AK171]
MRSITLSQLRSMPDTSRLTLWCLVMLSALFLSVQSAFCAETLNRFVGSYSGSAEVEQIDGTVEQRDMSVAIRETYKGFEVQWSTAIRRADGDAKTKSYKIEFIPSERDGVFSAAMQTNVFGHTVQMNPMKGEPFVWARVIGDTLTIFSLYVAENGDYLMQQYDRTVADGGLELDFSLHRNGMPSRKVSTFLTRD